MQKLKKSCPRAAAILLSLMMMVVFVPTFAFAAGGDEDEGITVFMTVSDQGTIAQTKDNEPMAWKEVNVTDQDDDGKLTFHDALVAAHEKYNASNGYAVSNSGWVTSLWGVENNPAGYSAIQNDGTTNLVTLAEIEDGDYLVASINQDTELYADWAAFFDKKGVSSTVGKTVNLKLQGFAAMTKNDPANGKNVKVTYSDLDDPENNGEATTDENGDVNLTFNKAGIYLVTAEGIVNNVIYSEKDDTGYWSPLGPQTKVDGKDIFGMSRYSDFYEEYWPHIGYTATDRKNGPYPYSEIQWMELDDFDAATFSEGHLLYTGNVSYNSPIIAPACIVEVGADPADVTMTISNKGVLAKAKDGSAMAEKPVTVKDLDFDGELSYGEALAAAHDAYFEGGAKAGYDASGNWVTRLWGIDNPGCYEATNGTPIPNGVSTDTVANGDALDVAILTDDTNWSDRVSSFDKTKVTVEEKKTFTVKLSGKGMFDGDLEPYEGVKIGTWDNGAFTQINQLTTDASGSATVSFDKPGTYILTAYGTVNREVSVWDSVEGSMVMKKLDCPLIAPYCIVTVTPHVHTLTAVKKQLATDKKAGNTAYWSCAGCGKFFSDAAGTKEIQKDSWVVAKSKMTVKAKKLKVKAKKKKTVFKKTKAFTVKKAPGKVTFKKVKGNKKIIVAKNGKVTVKKGLKKNKTYKVKVKVTSAKTAKYAKITKTVTLTIKVK